VRRCLGGDQEACTALVEEYARMVGTVIWRVTGDRGGVEDMAQETFLRVFRGLGYFDGRARLSTWIYTIAHRVAIDSIRSRTRQPGVEQNAFRGNPGQDPEAAAAQEEIDRIVAEQLQALPEKYRLPLVYATLDELDYQTIGAMLKVKPGTVKTLVFRARQLLKQRVEGALAQRAAGIHAT